MKTLSLVLATALISFGSIAEAKTKTNTTNINSEATRAYEIETESTNEGFKFEARPGLGTFLENFTYGMNLEGKYGFAIGQNTLMVGMETGFFRTPISSYGENSFSISAINFTPSASFEFPVSNSVNLYTAANAGISLKTTSVSQDYGSSGSLTEAVFTWKFRPGLVVANKFVAELPIGTIDGNFFFIPSVGVRF